ncbi:MAG: FG-GAP-like repeat-containing protein [bacterium]
MFLRPTNRFPIRIFIVILGTLLWNVLYAQSPQIVSFSPGRYSMQNSATTTISVLFDQAMNGSTIVPSNFLVNGNRTGYHDGTLSYNSSTQTASFSASVPFQAGETVSVILTGNIQNSSGLPLAGFQWSFYIQATTATGELRLDSTYTTGTGPHFVGLGYLSNDFSLDMAIPHSKSHNVYSWLNLGNGDFIQNGITAVGTSPRAVALGDFDSDGDLDVAVVNEVNDTVSILNNDGAGVLTARDTTFSVGVDPGHISTADFNNDGFLDLATVDNVSNAISLLINTGDGNFQTAVSYPVGANPQISFIADFNNDGAQDVVVTNADDSNISLLFNDGTGVFGAPQNTFIGSGPRSVVAQDFNLDGLIDLAIANRSENTVGVLNNLGGGSFSLPSYFPVGSDPFSLSTNDFEGDLDPDLVVTNRLSNDVYMLLNNGSGSFVIDSTYSTGTQPRALNTGDFNGDGVMDMAVANWADNSVQVFLNTFKLVSNQPPAAPTLTAPNDLSSFNPNTAQVVFSWDVPTDPDGDVLHFKLEIDQSSDFSSPVLTFDSSNDAAGFSPAPPVDQSTASVSYTLSTPLAEGLYFWRVTASDGQISGASSPSRRFSLDSASPVISGVVIDAPVFLPNWYNQNTTPAIDFGVQYDEDNADKAQFDLGALGGAQENLNISSGSAQVTQTSVTLTGASDGSYTLSATILDKAGNQAGTSADIALDGTAPGGAQTSSPAVSSQTSFTVSWSSGSDGAGSGLSGAYDVRVQVDGGAWAPWLTNFQGTSSVFTGQQGSTYAFEASARDNVGNIEPFLNTAESTTLIDTISDVTAPGAPVTLTAGGANPSPWQNNVNFQVAWQAPSDPSGIAKALYKRGAAPAADFDTTGSVSGSSSFFVNATEENGQEFHLWFLDNSGNVDFQNHGSVLLRYDATPPSNTVASSPATSAETNFSITWTGTGADGNGSGLSGVYNVRVQVDGGPWTEFLTDFQETSSTFQGLHGKSYGFEVAAYDVAGNLEAFLNIAETQTVVDTNANDVTAPGPPPVLTAGGVNPSPWQSDPFFEILWQEFTDPSGIARALYKLGSAPTADFDTTGSVTSGSSIRLRAEQEDGQNFYLWFEDQKGNIDFQNNAVVELRYDATPPEVFEIDFPNPGFVPNWFNQGASSAAQVEINYDENHLQRLRLEAAGLDTIEVEPGQSGLDVFEELDVDIQGKPDGVYKLIFTLIDSAGNAGKDSVEIKLDSTPPSGTQATSPDTSSEVSFLVSWGGSGSDGSGSGLSGSYNVRYQENGGPWQNWLTEFSGNSDVFSGEAGKIYGFEAAALDNLLNEEPFDNVAETVTLVDTAFSDPVPPTVFHSSPLLVDEGEDVIISAQVEDNSQIVEVVLFFKQSGQASFQSMLMTDKGGGNFEATLTASQLSNLGVNYFIRASDGRNFAFHPITNSDTVPHNISVRILGTDSEGLKRDQPQPGGDSAFFYRMFSVPLNLENKDPLAVLQDDLGSYDRKKWRLFQYNSLASRYDEYPDVNSFAPGTALWLIIRDAEKTIDTGLGTTVVTNQPFEMTLAAGWTDIALPFPFSVNWSDVQVLEGDANDIMGPYFFSDDWVTPDNVPTLAPWEGYAIFSETAGVKIAILPIMSQGSPVAKTAVEKIWEIGISARTGDFQNKPSRIGVSTDASPQWDQLDYLEPPHISEFVTVRFPHKDWPKFPGHFLTDFRPPFEDGQIWHFEVATSLKNSEIHLDFTDLESLPPDFQATLFDNFTLQKVDLREEPGYSFFFEQNSLTREFDVIIGTETYSEKSDDLLHNTPKEFFLSQNFPNPFNAGTSLNYKISISTKVVVKVLNLLGQEVKTLVNKNQAPGSYRIHWDGTSNNGFDASSGVYVIKLQAGAFQQVRKVILVR